MKSCFPCLNSPSLLAHAIAGQPACGQFAATLYKGPFRLFLGSHRPGCAVTVPCAARFQATDNVLETDRAYHSIESGEGIVGNKGQR